MSKATHEDRPTTPKSIEDCHALLAWMLPQLDKFPRSRRFTLGSRIEDGLLFVLEKLVEAAYSRSNVALLLTPATPAQIGRTKIPINSS